MPDKQIRDNENNVVPKTTAVPGHETLKFHFTPVGEPHPDRDENPHAKATTHIPEVVDQLKGRFEDAVLETGHYAGETTVRVAADALLDVARYLKDDLGFRYLADLGGQDRFTEDERFEMFYNLCNLDDGQRLRLTVRLADSENPEVDSVMGIWRSANWNEREAFDMLGIRFRGHEDLRRMFMPEDFEHFPQRKEFPLLGIPGSLPLPPRVPEGELTHDPFAAAHEGPTLKSFEEPESVSTDED